MRKKITPILVVLVILFVVLVAVDPELREKVKAIIAHLSGWLGIDWGTIKRWRTAGSLYRTLSQLA
jgi:hypothetical protein